VDWRAICCFVLLGLSATEAQARHHHSRAHDATETGQFDYYVLSLSWAPTYCLTHSGDRAECGGKGYGLVVHGLWPQFDGGGYPENCSTQYELTADAAARGRTLYPSERLMQHEWYEHGSCSGVDALDYFQTVDRATAVVKAPPALEAPQTSQDLNASQTIDLFRRANAQMPVDALVVVCNRGDLSEVRVCLSKDLAVRTCGRGVRSTCPGSVVTVPASR
jgi:ribonuclease T2